MSEYLMIMHEVRRARLVDQARKADAEPVGRYGVIRRDGIFPKVEARNEVGSKGATR